MSATTTPEKVRNELGVDADDYSNEDLEDDIAAAESFVERRLGGHMTDDALLGKITTLVAADMLYPRVTGESKGQQISQIEQGNRAVRFANSSADSATGNSPHWQKAVRLDDTGQLETDEFFSYTL